MKTNHLLLLITPLILGVTIPVLAIAPQIHMATQGESTVNLTTQLTYDFIKGSAQTRCHTYDGMTGHTLDAVYGSFSLVNNGPDTVIPVPNGSYADSSYSQDDVLVLISPIIVNSDPNNVSSYNACTYTNGTNVTPGALLASGAFIVANYHIKQYEEGSQSYPFNYNNLNIFIPQGYNLVVFNSGYSLSPNYHMYVRTSMTGLFH